MIKIKMSEDVGKNQGDIFLSAFRDFEHFIISLIIVLSDIMLQLPWNI